MKRVWHKTLNKEKWCAYPILQQILMIGSEMARAKNLILKQNSTEVGNCYERAFELLDLCKYDPKWKPKLKELLRFREILGYAYLYKRNDLTFNNQLYQILLFWHPQSAKVKI